MMGRVTISSGCGEDTTSISNIFIDEYLQDANDAQIKIYLYLLRMMSANLPTSVTALADKFNHTEAEVIRSLNYWENKGLICLEYDSSQNLTGIHMEDIVTKSQMHYNRHRDDNVKIVNPVATDTVISEPVGTSPDMAAMTEAIPKKPSYSASELKSFKQTAGQNLLFIAEQYFGRPLNTVEMTTVYYIYDELNFSDDLLDYLMQYCVDNHKTDFRYMEKVAINWSQKGIKTPEQARAEIFRHDSDVITIMKALGMENAPTEKEVSFMTKWRGELGFTMEIVLEACDRTVMATQKNRLRYCDSILRNWHSKNVMSREDIARLDADFSADLAKKRSKASISPFDTKLRLSESSIRPGVTQNRFNQFQQNTYDFAELEKKLLDN